MTKNKLRMQLASLAFLSTFSLGPFAPLALQVLVISAVQLAHRAAIANLGLATQLDQSRPTRLGQFGLAQLGIVGALMVGSGLSFVLSAGGSGSVVARAETIPALIYYSFTTVFVPAAAIGLSEAMAAQFGTSGGSGWNGLLIRGWMLAAGGVVQEQLSGVGRTVWWIHGGHQLGWLAGWVGPSGVDLALGFVAAGLADVGQGMMMARVDQVGVAESGDEDHTVASSERYQDDQSDNDPAHWDITSTAASEQTRSPLGTITPAKMVILATVALLVLSPYLPTLTTPATQPSHIDESFTYPPVTVACIAPAASSSNKKTTPATELDEWLAETRRFGNRARIVSWSEGAVRLDKGKGKEDELWAKVAEVADQYGVHILATYLLPAPSPASPHKLLNLATLIGPSAESGKPNVVWSTFKHLPVPFVESYSHSARLNPALGSAPNSLPLATIHLPHGKHTPGPHQTPLQPLAVTAGICLDVASPSLFQHYAHPVHNSDDDHDDEQQKRAFGEARSPALILNPSSVPPPHSLALTQLEQAQARAVEANAWVLRCDGPSGISALVSPGGEVRAVRMGGREGWGSWEGEIDGDGARGESFYGRRLGGREWVVLGGVAGLWAVGLGTRAVVRRRKGGIGLVDGVAQVGGRVKGAVAGVRERIAGSRAEPNLIDF